MAAGEPVDDCLVVRIRYEGVAEDAVSYTLLQSFDDADPREVDAGLSDGRIHPFETRFMAGDGQ